MKKLVQNTGVRKWFGDDFVTIQDEANAVIEGFFGHFGQPFILSGCGVDGATIAAGIVGLIHADGFKLCRFAGAVEVTFPYYLKPVKTEETRLYLDGATKPVAYAYTAEASETSAAGYLEIKADESTPRFNDVIQDANHRFCTDDEKEDYAGQGAAAVNLLRDSIEETFDTLQKLKDYLDYQLTHLDYSEVEIGWSQLTDVPEFQGSANLITNNIDFSGKPILRKTIAVPTVFTCSNLIENKSMTLILDGDTDATFPAYFKKANEKFYDGTAANMIQMLCTNSGVGTEEVWYSITREEA